MDITVLENPYVDGKTANVLFMGNKVAKMNKDTKLPKIRETWAKGLAQLQSAETSVNAASTANDGDNILSKLDASSVDYNMNAQEVGTKKLKVNSVVRAKALKYYNAQGKSVIAPVEEVKEEKKEEKQEPVEAVSDTRMSRLERTGEMPAMPEVETKVEPAAPVNDVINTPSRFQNEPVSNPFDALINDKKEESSLPLTRESLRSEEESKNLEQNMGGDPNLYTKLVHGAGDNYENDELSLKLQEAKNKLSTATEEREKARKVNASLEEEVNSVRVALENLKREKAIQEQKELDNTLSMLRDAKADILDETRRYDDLQEELAELIRQRDALIGNSESDGYSARRAA